MTDLDTTTAPAGYKVRAPRERPCIPLPNGDVLEPRRQLAASIGVTDRTARKLNLKTTYIGGVAYVPRNASLQQLAEDARHRSEPYGGGRRGRKSTTR
jgi:hypothetical protein